MSQCVRRIAALLVFALLFVSCAPKRSELMLDTHTVDAAMLIKIVKDGQARLHSMVGGGSVTFESPEIAGSASFDLAMKKPDSLLVRFEGPFGLDVGTVFLSSRKYLVYNSLENRVITGVPQAEVMRSVIPFDLTYEQILDAFSGQFSLPANLENVRTYTVDGNQFLLSTTLGKNLCSYWIDPEYWFVSKYQIQDADGRVLLEALASAMTEQDSVSAPRRIKVKFPEDGRQISIYYSSLALNVPHPSFEFSIPDNAQTIIR
jgi:outer membrane lipoprotein-sorting protein